MKRKVPEKTKNKTKVGVWVNMLHKMLFFSFYQKCAILPTLFLLHPCNNCIRTSQVFYLLHWLSALVILLVWPISGATKITI